jgi:hypothetical protein
MNSEKNHILFIVPDGIGIKNYLYSNIISHIKDNTKITIWSTLPIEAFSDVKRIHNLEFKYLQIQLAPENSITRLYREATTYARLVFNSKSQDNPTILSNWRRPKYSIKVKVLFKCAEILGRYLSKKYTRILNFEKKGISQIDKKTIDKYVKNLKELSPTSVFITHQRVAGLMPICIAAKKLGIKSTTAIFSWDNLPKARLAVKTDNYLVWSQWMKNEMKSYYPEIPESRVKLVGTPQFEFYLDENRKVSRDSFAQKHGLNPNKKWICFSGDDITTSPYDQLFLRDITKSLEQEKDNIQIIFRRCPVDFSSRYDETLKTYKDFIISIDPIWNIESETSWVGYFPKYEDINMQVNLAYHCDAVVNLGSTMALDFSTYNKPCLYLNYNPSTDNAWSTKIIYNFQHFRSMRDLDAVGWVNSKDDIRKMVISTLKLPQEIASNRKEWMQTLVLHPIDENSKKIAKALL